MAIIISGTTGIDMGNTSVSNASQVEVQEEQVSPFSGFKNYIINGKKVVNQRGLTSTNNSYNQDRWYKAGNNWFQGIEGDNNLISGKTYTLSWVGSASASYYIGTATSATINAQTFTPIANGGSFTLTISAGQNLWIKFESDATGSTFNFVQLEEGLVATPFENRPIGLELSLCQRYYEKSFNVSIAPSNGSNTTSFSTEEGIFNYTSLNGTLAGGHNSFKVEKRVIPTMTKYGNSNGHWCFTEVANINLRQFDTTLWFKNIGTSGFSAEQQAKDQLFIMCQGHWTASAEL